MTTDGIAPIMPSNRNVFRVSRSTDSSDIVYLGLADLGQTTGEDVTDDYDYKQDGDNYFDICFDLTDNLEVLEDGVSLEVLCDETLDKSQLYPPKGKPYSCKYQNVFLSKSSKPNLVLLWSS